jgi:hypothetical protein
LIVSVCYIISEIEVIMNQLVLDSDRSPILPSQEHPEEKNWDECCAVAEKVGVALAIILVVGALITLTILFPEAVLAGLAVVGAGAGAICGGFFYFLGVLGTGH